MKIAIPNITANKTKSLESKCMTQAINIIAGIPDMNLTMEVIKEYAQGKNEEDVEHKISTQNIFGIRTKKSRERFLSAINSAFLQFKTEDHETIFYSLFKSEDLLQAKQIALYMQFAINNQLFYDLTVDVFLELYYAGRLTLPKSELVSYLYSLKEEVPEIRDWSDSTIEIIASKYLTFLKKLSLLKGKAKKEFKNITLDDYVIAYGIYLIKSLNGNESDITENRYSPLYYVR